MRILLKLSAALLVLSSTSAFAWGQGNFGFDEHRHHHHHVWVCYAHPEYDHRITVDGFGDERWEAAHRAKERCEAAFHTRCHVRDNCHEEWRH